MTYTTLDELNDTSLETILQFPSRDFALFWPLIQLAFFIIIVLASYYAEKDRTGRGNFLSSLAVGGWVSIIVGMFFNYLQLIDRTTFIITFVLSAIFIAIYMLTDN